MKLNEDINLMGIAKETHGYVGADIAQLCSESGLQCIRENLHLFDIEDEKIDVEVLEKMSVSQEHFKYAINNVNPSSLRQTVVEVPDVKWEDIGGQKFLFIRKYFIKFETVHYYSLYFMITIIHVLQGWKKPKYRYKK